MKYNDCEPSELAITIAGLIRDHGEDTFMVTNDTFYDRITETMFYYARNDDCGCPQVRIGDFIFDNASSDLIITEVESMLDKVKKARADATEQNLICTYLTLKKHDFRHTDNDK